MLRWCILVALGMAGLAAADAPVGWLNDGTGIFAGTRCPVGFDGAAGTGVRWKAPLPNWSNSSPIVAGGRVYAVSEPVDYAPILTCHDAETGKELWRRDLDAVASLPAGEQAAARTELVENRRWVHALVALSSRVTEAHKAGKASGPEWDALMQRLTDLGGIFKGQIGNHAGGSPKALNVKNDDPRMATYRKYHQLGIVMGGTWTGLSLDREPLVLSFGTWDGIAYPTPVSDGAAVWTVTAHNLYSCHDRDGKLLWQVRLPPADLKTLTEAQKKLVTGADGKTRWPHGWPGAGHFSTSPLLADGVLVSNAGAWLRGLDAATGRVLWEWPERENIDQNMAVPRLITLGGQRLVISVGGAVVRVKDGARLGQVPVACSAKMEIDGPLVAGDLVIGPTGDWRDRDYVAVRLALEKDVVTCTGVWRVKAKERRGWGLWRTLAKDGRLYHFGSILEAATGAMAGEKLPCARGGYCWYGAVIVGDAYLSMDHQKGLFHIRDLATGKERGKGTLPANDPAVHDEERKRAHAHAAAWSVCGAASPFAWKDRLYLRTFDNLWCVGP